MKKVYKNIKQVGAEKTNYSKSAKTHTGIGDTEVTAVAVHLLIQFKNS